jgi:O-antigen/teichoic acid export membrane protein
MSLKTVAQKPEIAQVETAGSLRFAALLTGASVVFVSSIASRLLEFLTRASLGRYLGPEQFGLLTSGLATLSILGTLIGLGLTSGIVRFVGHYRGTEQAEKVPRLLYGAFWLVMVISLSVGVILWYLSAWAAINLFNTSQMQMVLRAVSVGLPLFATFSIMMAILQAEKDARTYAWLHNVLLPLIRFVGSLLVVFLGWQLREALSIHLVIALLLPWLWTLIGVSRRTVQLISLQRVALMDLGAVLRFSLPLLVGSLFGLTVWQLDVLLLQSMWGSAEAGLYSAAMIIGRLPNMILLAFTFVLAPMAAQLYSAGKLTVMQRIYGRIIDLVFILGLPTSLSFFLFAPLLLHVLFGAAYTDSALVLRILAVGFFFHSLAGPNGNTLMMIGRSRLYLVDTMIIAVVNIVLYVTLIPPLGAVGAALATVVGLLLLNLLFSTQLYRLTGINPFSWIRYKLLFPLCTAGVLSHSVVYLCRDCPSWFRLALALIVLFVTYSGLALLLRLIKISEIKELLQIFYRTDHSAVTTPKNENA